MGTYICEANAYSQGENGMFQAAVSTFIHVLFPPEVQVLIPKTVNNGDAFKIVCNTFGNPDNITRNLIHMLNGNYIRTFQNIPNEFEIKSASYQDSGVYICEACNGVPDKNTKIVGQNETVVNYPAQFCADDERQLQFYPSLNEPYTIRIFFITTEIIQTVTWFNTTEVLANTSEIKLNLSQANFPCHIYNKVVNVTGYAAEMDIEVVKRYHKGNYSVEIKTQNSSRKEFKVILPGPPGPLAQQRIDNYDFKSITLSWTKGLHNVHIKEFVIKCIYVEQNEFITIIIQDNKERTEYSYTIYNLQPSTKYKIVLYAQNEEGVSTNWTKSITTLEQPQSSPLPIAAIGGGIGSAAFLCIFLLLFICFLRKQNSRKCRKNSNITEIEQTHKYEGNNTTTEEVHTYSDLNSNAEPAYDDTAL